MERSADGLRTWNTVHNGAAAVTSSSVTAYPGSGHRTVTSTAPDGTHTISDFLYGRLVSMTAYDSGTTQIGQTTYAYDTHGRQNVITDARTGPTTNYFNTADQVSGTRLPSADGIQSPQITSNLFDNMGRIQTQILADSTAVTNEYYLTGQLKRTYGSRTYPVGYGYDAQGRMTNMTNWATFATGAGARVTTWFYNQYRGWLDSKTYDNGASPGPVYSYTAAGRLQNRLWARGTNTTYAYNNAGDLATVIYDDGLTLGITNGYDRRGRLTNIINGPSTCSLAYDDAGNLLTESYSGGVLDLVSIQNIYDDFLRRKTNITKYNGSNLTIVTNKFDTGGRLMRIGDGTNLAAYSYLANSPLVEQIVLTNSSSLRMTVKKGYDNLNRLTGITNLNPSSAVLDKHTYAYNSANQRTAVTDKDNSVWSYGYDSLGQVTSGKKYWSDAAPAAGQQFTYAFDDIGNRTQAQTGGNELGLGLRTASYSANNLNQYASRTVPGGVDIIGSATSGAIVTVNDGPTSRHEDYFRAEVGVDNGTGAAWQAITAKAVVGGATNLLSIASGNVFVPQNPESFSYDADGNLTQDGRWTYQWDPENRLINMTSLISAPTASKFKLDFTYDYAGRRLQKLVSTNNGGGYVASYTNRFVYDAWNLQAVLDHQSSVLQSFLWPLHQDGSLEPEYGVANLLATAIYSGSSATSYFPCYDGNGNVMALVSGSNSSKMAQYEYGPFGELTEALGFASRTNAIRFSSRFQDDETGLLYFGYRYYDSSRGGWFQVDPIEEDGGVNLYGFLANNSISNQDQLGLAGGAATVPFPVPDGRMPTTAPPPPETPAVPAVPLGAPAGTFVVAATGYEYGAFLHNNHVIFTATCPANSYFEYDHTDHSGAIPKLELIFGKSRVSKVRDDLGGLDWMHLPNPDVPNCAGKPTTVKVWMRTRFAGFRAGGRAELGAKAYYLGSVMFYKCKQCSCPLLLPELKVGPVNSIPSKVAFPQ